MNQEMLNFKIMISIQGELYLHNSKLFAISKLIEHSHEDAFAIDKARWGLSRLIDSWMDEQVRIIEDTENKIRETPGFIVSSADEMLRQSAIRKYKPAEVDKIIEKLRGVVEGLGCAYPTAPGLIEKLERIKK